MITIRAARCEDAGGIATVHVTSWRTTYAGIIPDNYLANLRVEVRQQYWQRMLCDPENAGRQYMFVAENEQSKIVGFASCGPENSKQGVYTGELYAIYLLASQQRSGIGRKLVQAVAQRLAQDGMNSMLVWVLAQNPSRPFYERLGGTPAGSQMIEIGGTQLEECAYGWSDTSSLR